MYTKYYQIAGITIKINSMLEMTKATFAPKFKLFEIKKPGHDIVEINHFFGLPSLKEDDLGKIVHNKSPWVIYENDKEYTYILKASPVPGDNKINQIMHCNKEYSKIFIYNNKNYCRRFKKGNIGALTLNPTDQILLSQILALRNGCYLHADGMKIRGKGYLFVGHSGAGKSTIATILQDKGEILCDDRMIVKKQRNIFSIYGNWSHGTLPIVSASSAPLKAVFFLNQSKNNTIQDIKTTMAKVQMLVACMVKPLNSNKWWNSSLDLIEDIANKIPCYNLFFNRNGRIFEKIISL